MVAYPAFCSGVHLSSTWHKGKSGFTKASHGKLIPLSVIHLGRASDPTLANGNKRKSVGGWGGASMKDFLADRDSQEETLHLFPPQAMLSAWEATLHGKGSWPTG